MVKITEWYKTKSLLNAYAVDWISGHTPKTEFPDIHWAVMFSQRDRQNLSHLKTSQLTGSALSTVASWPLHPQSKPVLAGWPFPWHVKVMKLLGKASLKQRWSDVTWFPLLCWPAWRRERQRKWALGQSCDNTGNTACWFLEGEFGKHIEGCAGFFTFL